MNSIPFKLKQILPASLIFGMIGGLMLVYMHLLINSNAYFEQGWWIIPNYPAAMLSTVLWLNIKGIKVNYSLSFFTGILIFILLTIVLFVFARIVIPHQQLWEHASRFLLVLGLALAAIAGFSLLFRIRTPPRHSLDAGMYNC